MSKIEIGRLWWAAMDTSVRLRDGAVPAEQETRAWLLVYFGSVHLERLTRRSHGRFPRPPGIDELLPRAAAQLGTTKHVRRKWAHECA